MLSVVFDPEVSQHVNTALLHGWLSYNTSCVHWGECINETSVSVQLLGYKAELICVTFDVTILS